MASTVINKKFKQVPSGIDGITLYQCENIVLVYVVDVKATNGAVGTLSIHPKATASLPCYPISVSFNCRLRIGTNGVVTVEASNGSDTLPSTINNVMAQGWFVT